ncbi:hypothetical protein F8153_01020 [Alkaliphilus serpentinus]|uniref:Uncharacterized protein n=2 Tax=Alkaliphilus serpentinus TaxID=1482731 RepID=A0A833M8M6_9FIRM|nr:hypothetical protein F8153_01020 [Alkaliphilus serpentinus]
MLISITLLTTTIIGYVFTVVKERYYLKNNIIFLDHKNLQAEDLEKVDVKHFMLGSLEIMSGDEVKIKLEDSASISGIVLGVIKQKNSISIITKSHGVKNLEVSAIKKMKIISRYGRFFTWL